MSSNLEQGLLESALNFLLSAAQYASTGQSEWNLKCAILHLFAGMEVSLKAVLQKVHWSLLCAKRKPERYLDALDVLPREHWPLLFAGIDNAPNNQYRQDLDSGNFSSVDPKEAIERLQKVAGTKLPTGFEDFLTKELTPLRNKLQHFHAVIHVEETKSLMAKGLKLVLDFLKQEVFNSEQFNRDNELLTKMYLEVFARCQEFEAFVEHSLQEIQGSIHKAMVVVACPFCLQETLVGDGDPHCLFCNYSISAKDLPSEKTVFEALCRSPVFIDRRLKEIQSSLDSANDVMECPNRICGGLPCATLVIGDGDPHCPFCNYAISAEELAEEMNEDGPIEGCPNCSEETCIRRFPIDGDSFYYCTSCGTAGHYYGCSKCGRLSTEEAVCPDCFPAD